MKNMLLILAFFALILAFLAMSSVLVPARAAPAVMGFTAI
jgi:hypothetical protein